MLVAETPWLDILFDDWVERNKLFPRFFLCRVKFQELFFIPSNAKSIQLRLFDKPTPDRYLIKFLDRIRNMRIMLQLTDGSIVEQHLTYGSRRRIRALLADKPKRKLYLQLDYEP